MILCDDKHLLYIEPRSKPSAAPVIDTAVLRLTAAWRQRIDTGKHTRGFHLCSCGAMSSNTDYILPGGLQTNSLALHYLAFHRDDVPDSEIRKLDSLPVAIAAPTRAELWSGASLPDRDRGER